MRFVRTLGPRTLGAFAGFDTCTDNAEAPRLVLDGFSLFGGIAIGARFAGGAFES